MSRLQLLTVLQLTTVGISALFGCGDDAGSVPAEGACATMQDGPVDVTVASPRADDSAPEPAWWDHRVDVTLVDIEAGVRGGYLKLDVATDEDYAFALSAEVPLSVVDVAGATFGALRRTAGGCLGIAVRLEQRIPPGIHYVELGPTEAAEVSLVVTTSAD